MIWMYLELQLFCMLLLAVLFRYHLKYEYQQKHEIRNIYVLAFVATIMDIFRWFFLGYSKVLFHIAYTLYISSFGFMARCWSDYLIRRYKKELCNKPWYKIIKSIPAIALTVFAATSFKTEWIYSLNTESLYGSLWGLIFTPCVYLIITSIIILGVDWKNVSEHEKRERLFLTGLWMPTVVVAIAQAFVLIKISMTISVLVSLLLFTLHNQYRKMRTDNLTKLLNRYGMDDEIREQLEEYRKDKTDLFYVIACDMDNFKHINDTWGHQEGDRALRLISNVLDSVVQQYDSDVFRIGGDEFVIIVDTSQEKIPEEICEKLRWELDRLEFRDDFDIRMSMGYARFDGESDIEELLNHADMHLYEAKRKSKQS